MKTILISVALVLVAGFGGFCLWAYSQSQRADNAWRPAVAQPTYTPRHPSVILDEAHHNIHTLTGRYRPLARLLTADGYAVAAGREKFSASTLVPGAILIIANAAGSTKPQFLGINLPFLARGRREAPAFTAAEIEAVRQWVEQGGSLLLIADHAPFGESAAKLAEAFGVHMNRGFVDIPGGLESSDPLLFSKANGRLGAHAILDQIERVMTFTGQSLDGPPSATVLLRLPPNATEAVPKEGVFKEQPAGAAQGLALAYGKGRVVVLGEAAMLTAQISRGERFGLNTPGNDNVRFALNVMRWLSRHQASESTNLAH